MVRASLISQQMCHRSGVGHDEGVLQYGSRDVHSKNSYSGRYNQKKNWQAGIVTFLSMPGHLTWALAGTL